MGWGCGVQSSSVGREDDGDTKGMGLSSGYGVMVFCAGSYLIVPL